MADIETRPADVEPETPSTGLVRVHRMTATRRLVHWANALSILAAAFTGMYIAKPFYSMSSNYVMEWNRTVHLTAAIILDVSVIVITYIYFFSSDPTARTELRPTRANWVRWQEAFLNVLMLNHRKRFDSRRPDPFNATMFLLLHLMVIVQLFTGLQLYVAGLESGISAVGSWWPWLIHFFTDWTTWMFGGLGGVRLVHHFMTYPILTWAMLHLYYEIWRTIMWKEGDIAITFGGYKLGRRNGE